MCRGCVTQCAESVPKISPFASHPHRSPVPASPCRKGSHIIYTPTSTLSPPHILSALRAFAETSSHFPANARILRVGRVCNTHSRACVPIQMRFALCSLLTGISIGFGKSTTTSVWPGNWCGDGACTVLGAAPVVVVVVVRSGVASLLRLTSPRGHGVVVVVFSAVFAV